MGVISITKEPGPIWDVAGWILRQTLDDAAANYQLSDDLKRVFELTEVYDGLAIDGLVPKQASEVVHVLKQTAEHILNGEIESGIVKKPYGNSETQEQYKSALRQLLVMLPD